MPATDVAHDHAFCGDTDSGDSKVRVMVVIIAAGGE
jgi:hypothetical protein